MDSAQEEAIRQVKCTQVHHEQSKHSSVKGNGYQLPFEINFLT
jgi:hypothetical protein